MRLIGRWDGLYLLDGLQHGPASVPGLGGLPDAVEARHTVPLPVLQLPVEGVGQHQHAVVQVEVRHLQRGGDGIKMASDVTVQLSEVCYKHQQTSLEVPPRHQLAS